MLGRSAELAVVAAAVVELAPVVAAGRGTAVALRRGEPGCSSRKLLEGCKELVVASSPLVEQQRGELEPLQD